MSLLGELLELFLNFLPPADNSVRIESMSRRTSTGRFSFAEEWAVTILLVLLLCGVFTGIMIISVIVHPAFLLLLPGPPLLWVFYVGFRALIREGIKEIRYKLSDWHERQNSPKEGPYR